MAGSCAMRADWVCAASWMWELLLHPLRAACRMCVVMRRTSSTRCSTVHLVRP